MSLFYFLLLGAFFIPLVFLLGITIKDWVNRTQVNPREEITYDASTNSLYLKNGKVIKLLGNETIHLDEEGSDYIIELWSYAANDTELKEPKLLFRNARHEKKHDLTKGSYLSTLLNTVKKNNPNIEFTKKGHRSQIVLRGPEYFVDLNPDQFKKEVSTIVVFLLIICILTIMVWSMQNYK